MHNKIENEKYLLRTVVLIKILESNPLHNAQLRKKLTVVDLLKILPTSYGSLAS
jgi:hypothetical protein